MRQNQSQPVASAVPTVAEQVAEKPAPKVPCCLCRENEADGHAGHATPDPTMRVCGKCDGQIGRGVGPSEASWKRFQKVADKWDAEHPPQARRAVAVAIVTVEPITVAKPRQARTVNPRPVTPPAPVAASTPSHLPTIKQREVERLKLARHSVRIDYAEQIVCVDGRKYFRLAS